MIEYIYLFLVAMLPIAELRGAIPLGIYWGLSPILVFIIAIIGNMVPVPLILLFLEGIEKYLRRSEKMARALDWIFERTYKKADEKVRRWEYLALILFVAIPLPGTGAWTGSLIAYLFKFDIKKSMLSIFIGVLIAGLIVLIASLGFLNIF
ncbi:small multi-drug export protein [Candidatus Aciduliprofundum boonei]|uniref:Small multi-drug export n=1 Tax=Aciduliprofundum boonei (strain DSM 19572 / T469) TaxID=439481 RepID=B5I9V8_ACIB4|nr:small multi-drug export protein [Candidatus Aciduliprofundum boonei]ADD08410.1 putative small multi-drug export [Aciduliprofundum boonei T469]EDY36981.1 Putative small multi-drug export protein [Aciduliprofundum boonei T469]HII55454.1 small multi-drug export protein [Candidatus Aciduliprofundum boonei]